MADEPNRETTRKIIVGFEPEHGGRDAVQLGRLFAEVLDAKPLVVTALPWPTYLMGVADLQKQMDTDMRARFATVRDWLGDLDAETRTIASPSAAAALHELAETEGAEMIVIASSHRSRLGRILAGSVGESLMHGAPCAIAIAPKGYADREPGHLLRVGVAFDGSPESWSALETAIGIAERCHGEVTVIVVADYPYYGYATTLSMLTANELRDAEREDKERLLSLAVGRLPRGLDRDSRVLTGEPGNLLSEVSSEFDLLVVGSRSYGPLRRTLLGSTSRELIKSAACPVLVLPRAVGIDPFGLRPRPAVSIAPRVERAGAGVAARPDGEAAERSQLANDYRTD